MPATIDYTSEDTLTDIFTADNFLDELHRYLGLDPGVASTYQPTDVNDLLHSCLHIVEQDQERFILTKDVTLKLPYHSVYSRDEKLYLPWGKVSSLTTFTYLNQDGTTDTADSDEYTLFSDEPSFLWSDNWTLALPAMESENPLPITITYTTGYTSFAQIPRSTLHALKLLCYHHFNNRHGDPLPSAYKHHVMQDALTFHRLREYISA